MLLPDILWARCTEKMVNWVYREKRLFGCTEKKNLVDREKIFPDQSPPTEIFWNFFSWRASPPPEIKVWHITKFCHNSDICFAASKLILSSAHAAFRESILANPHITNHKLQAKTRDKNQKWRSQRKPQLEGLCVSTFSGEMMIGSYVLPAWKLKILTRPQF